MFERKMAEHQREAEKDELTAQGIRLAHLPVLCSRFGREQLETAKFLSHRARQTALKNGIHSGKLIRRRNDSDSDSTTPPLPPLLVNEVQELIRHGIPRRDDRLRPGAVDLTHGRPQSRVHAPPRGLDEVHPQQFHETEQ
mmetsp:Transcript_21193/g.61650  ORF Transcript_21193/g.61650 Transcript_21193/m.61650 type:complete len:140 (-) Transcript_21193:1675-2094(-)